MDMGLQAMAVTGDDSALALGLENEAEPGPSSKKRRLSGPKVKRSREEMFQEEIDKSEAKYQEMLTMMSDPSSSVMPTPAAVAKLQRVVQNRMQDAKEQGSFQASARLQDLHEALTCFKEALRLTAMHLPSNGHPKKQHADAFVEALQKLSKQVLDKFPGAVIGQYRHLCHQKDSAFLKSRSVWSQGTSFEGLVTSCSFYFSLNRCPGVSLSAAGMPLRMFSAQRKSQFKLMTSPHNCQYGHFVCGKCVTKQF